MSDLEVPDRIYIREVKKLENMVSYLLFIIPTLSLLCIEHSYISFCKLYMS